MRGDIIKREISWGKKWSEFDGCGRGQGASLCCGVVGSDGLLFGPEDRGLFREIGGSFEGVDGFWVDEKEAWRDGNVGVFCWFFVLLFFESWGA